MEGGLGGLDTGAEGASRRTCRPRSTSVPPGCAWATGARSACQEQWCGLDVAEGGGIRPTPHAHAPAQPPRGQHRHGVVAVTADEASNGLLSRRGGQAVSQHARERPRSHREIAVRQVRPGHIHEGHVGGARGVVDAVEQSRDCAYERAASRGAQARGKSTEPLHCRQHRECHESSAMKKGPFSP